MNFAMFCFIGQLYRAGFASLVLASLAVLCVSFHILRLIIIMMIMMNDDGCVGSKRRNPGDKSIHEESEA